MKFSLVIFLLSVLTFSAALPLLQARAGNGLTTRNATISGNSTSTSQGVAKPTTLVNVEDLNEDATSTSSSSKATTSKATSSQASSKTPTAAQVKAAVSGFANDANTVSKALNSLPSMTDKSTISSTASKAFDAESNEDSQRAVLAAAAGSAGSSSNSKIVKNTPTVLNGLKAIMKDPTTVKKNVDTIAAARNPNILPSITQLSNAALDAMKLPQTAQKFPATGQ